MSDSPLRQFVGETSHVANLGRGARERGPSIAGSLIEKEETADLGAFGWLRGTRERAVMLELRKKDGAILAIGYNWLERIEFDPSDGITLVTAGQRIHIRGLNLNAAVRPSVRLFEGLTRHRVPWLRETAEPDRFNADNQATLIERIEW